MLVTQSCPMLCDPTDCSPSVHGILQQEYWSGLSFPSPGDLPDPGIKPGSPALQKDSLSSEPPGKYKCMTINYLFSLDIFNKVVVFFVLFCFGNLEMKMG